MTNYRWYLGGDNNSNGSRFDETLIGESIQSLLQGYTVIPSLGVWKGLPRVENSWVIEHLGILDAGIVREVKRRLEQDFRQHEVIAISFPVQSY